MVFTELSDGVDIVDPTVEMDSMDSRGRTLRLDGLRGGRAGVGRGVPIVRGGGRGGSAGGGVGVTGGKFTPSGWLPSGLAAVGAWLRTGGLLTVCRRCRAGGRDVGGGGGGGFFLAAGGTVS